MAEIIKFAPGVSEILALKYDTGKLVQGKFGEQFQYSTVDDRVFWLDGDPARDIEREMQELGIRAGQEFRLTKVRTSHGGHRYQVERVGDSGGHNVPSRSGAGRVVSAPVTEPQRSNNGFSGQNSPNHSAPAPEPPAATPASAKLMACLKAAIDAAVEAEAYAARQGLELRFSSEDIRTMANTISMNGGAR